MDDNHSMGRDVSGITPSGRLTLGNHLGALRRFVERQVQVDGYYFVSDLHALTTQQDPARLRHATLSTAAALVAAGLDQARSTVFVQSHVPTHVAMSYLLECTAYVGELSRMVQFKEKGGRPRTRASLFTDPCLVAADILLYGADRVPCAVTRASTSSSLATSPSGSTPSTATRSSCRSSLPPPWPRE